MRREQLLGEAARLFGKQGYDATSTDQIARAAGLTKGALYHHFKNKEMIMVELVRGVIKSHLDSISRFLKPSMTPVDLLRALEESDKPGCDHSLNHDLDFRAQIAKVPGVQRMVSKAIRDGCELTAQHFSREFGRTHQQRFKLALMIFCLWDGLKIRQTLSPGLLNMKEMMAVAENLINHTRH